MTTKEQDEAKAALDTRIAPDPFAAVLPALAALGAIASIASVAWVAQDKTPERAKLKRRAAVALRDLESCCLGLAEIFRRFQRNPKLFGGEGAAAAASPMKFGVHGPRVTADAARGFQQLMNDLASMLVLASQNTFDVMAAIEDGEINPPDDVFTRFGEAQEKLNRLIQTRATLRAAVEGGAEVATLLTDLVRQLRTYLVD
jgi:hypothetical protein